MASEGLGKVGELRISVSATLIAIVLLILVTVVFYWLTADLKQTAIFLVAAAAASGSTLGAFYSARALRVTAAALKEEKERQCRALAFHFISRWNDPGLYHVRDAIRALFEMDPRKDEFERAVKERHTNVIHFLNFLEEIGLAIEFGGAHEAILKEAYAGVVSKAWEKMQYWIGQNRRDYGQEDLWIKFENLSIKWRRA
jgi:type IV secretory pathway VirB3-like protein